jgi:sulfur-oxidizing protein SoxX
MKKIIPFLPLRCFASVKIFSLVDRKPCLFHPIILLLIGASATFTLSGDTIETETTRIGEGEKLTFDRNMGNCLACHAVGIGKGPGNLAPPLFEMKERFPDIDKLTRQISNSLLSNQDSVMPPFGLHGILSEDEISKIVDYLYTL